MKKFTTYFMAAIPGLIFSFNLSAQESTIDYEKLADCLANIYVATYEQADESGYYNLDGPDCNRCSGFFIDRIHIVTNAHCLIGAKQILAATRIGSAEGYYLAIDGVVDQPDWSDLVLIRLKKPIDEKRLMHNSTILSPTPILRGEKAVIVRGTSSKDKYVPFVGSFKYPLIDFNKEAHFVTSIEIRDGESGSPVFDEFGRVKAVMVLRYYYLNETDTYSNSHIQRPGKRSLAIPIINFVSEFKAATKIPQAIPLNRWLEGWVKKPYYKYLVGTVLSDEKDYLKAREYFLGALGIPEEIPVNNVANDEARIWYRLGFSNFLSNENERAVIALRNVSDRGEQNHETMLYLAYSLGRIREDATLSEAEEILKGLISFKSRNPFETYIYEAAQGYLALIYYWQDDRASYKQQLKLIQKMDPDLARKVEEAIMR